MKTTEATFCGQEACDVFYRVWEPEGGSIKAVVLLSHGYAEHAGRYTLLAEHLTERGYKIYAPDHRCHGRSGGEKALIDRMSCMLEDLEHLLRLARSETPAIPAFILGHSMGGLLAASFTIQHQEQLAGTILSAPLIMVGAGVPGILKLISNILARIAPRMGVQDLDSAWLSHDPAIAESYDRDPLNYRGKIMARSGAEMLRQANWALQKIPVISIPVLCLHGSEDKLADPAGSQYVYDHVSSVDKTIHLFDGLYHEIFNEYEKDKVFAFVSDWLDAHCQ